jgi:hypothetical protein
MMRERRMKRRKGFERYGQRKKEEKSVNPVDAPLSGEIELEGGALD